MEAIAAAGFNANGRAIELGQLRSVEIFENDLLSYNEDVPPAISGADGIVKPTPVGMGKFPGLPVESSLLRPRHWVADEVYFPLETELLREAKMRGCCTMSGAGMAVFQAAEAFRLFSREEPSRERMLLHFDNM